MAPTAQESPSCTVFRTSPSISQDFNSSGSLEYVAELGDVDPKLAQCPVDALHGFLEAKQQFPSPELHSQLSCSQILQTADCRGVGRAFQHVVMQKSMPS